GGRVRVGRIIGGRVRVGGRVSVCVGILIIGLDAHSGGRQAQLDQRVVREQRQLQSPLSERAFVVPVLVDEVSGGLLHVGRQRDQVLGDPSGEGAQQLVEALHSRPEDRVQRSLIGDRLTQRLDERRQEGVRHRLDRRLNQIAH